MEERTGRHRRIPTRNQTGWASSQLNEVSQFFVEFARGAALPVLDIGAAFGIASLAALDAGATVIANDLDPRHLDVILAQAPAEHRKRLLLIPGRFPRHLCFLGDSLAAVHASNVFHFLTGPQVSQGLASAYHWLAPGGRLFVQASTPWQKPFQDFVPLFTERRRAGAEWPGWIENTAEVSAHRKLSQIPPRLHLLDDQTLAHHARKAAFAIEQCWLYRRSDLPASLFLDGRECVGLIARKPESTRDG
jgi:SAM-dependent methyltransferase